MAIRKKMTMLANCQFETARLLVREWHSLDLPGMPEATLPEIVVRLMTPGATEWLPPDWQGEFSPERALEWIMERDSEGTVLLVLEKATGRAVGLVILGEAWPASSREIRLGYLLSETVWGKGIATELVRGFTDWCKRQAGIGAVVAGVDSRNVASVRVLEKAGFRLLEPEDSQGELKYRLATK